MSFYNYFSEFYDNGDNVETLNKSDDFMGYGHGNYESLYRGYGVEDDDELGNGRPCRGNGDYDGNEIIGTGKKRYRTRAGRKKYKKKRTTRKRRY